MMAENVPRRLARRVWEVSRMRRRIWAAVLLLTMALAVLSGCRAQPTVQESPSAGPADSAGPETAPPQESAPAETDSGEEDGLVVDGQRWDAQRCVSQLGYALSYPPELVALNQWAGGETYEVIQAPGTYLAVSLYAGTNIDQAVDRLQFDYAIDQEPTGAMFGAEGYAGVRMSQDIDGLHQEYILCQHGEDIFLIELAIFPGDEGEESLLQAMLDTFTIL